MSNGVENATVRYVPDDAPGMFYQKLFLLLRRNLKKKHEYINMLKIRTAYGNAEQGL